MKTVGEVSALAGIAVRTLRHYDERGLLSPSGRTDPGYRLYSERDLERLQEILGRRALGFSPDEIGEREMHRGARRDVRRRPAVRDELREKSSRG